MDIWKESTRTSARAPLEHRNYIPLWFTACKYTAPTCDDLLALPVGRILNCSCKFLRANGKMYLGSSSPLAPFCFAQLLNILPRSRQCTRLAMALALHAAKCV